HISFPARRATASRSVRRARVCTDRAGWYPAKCSVITVRLWRIGDHFAISRRIGGLMAFRLLLWRRPRINVVEMHGVISPRPGAVSMSTMAPLINRAFASASGRPVVLDIESPGGSPVQSDLIAGLIRRRAQEDEVRVYAVIREVGASGGYWLACAADEIHANPMSIVGSIGVRGGGFGFPDMLARVGVERRLYTAGTNKARLDPFSPEKPE